MFNFNKLNEPQLPAGIVEEDYGIEVDGHMLAMEEAFADVAAINVSFADMNAQCVSAYMEGAATGGEEGAKVALEAFQADPVMEGFAKDVKDKVVKALKAMKEKIMAFFRSARQYFDALVKNAKDFAEKYEDQLKDKDVSGMKVDMFDYTLDKVKIGDIFKQANSELTKGAVLHGTEEAGTAGAKKIEAAVMSKICGDSVTSIEAFRKALYRKLRNGKATKSPMTPNITKMLAELKSGEEVENCKEAQSECESSFDEIIKEYESKADEADKGSDASKAIKRHHATFVAGKNIAMAAFGAYKSAAVERNSAYKSCLSKALHHSSKDEGKKD